MADLIEYPLTDYNSYGTIDEAELYFESRLNADKFLNANGDLQAAALITAFQSLQELDLDIDLETDESPLEKLTFAQFEQALHLLTHDLDSPNLSRLSLGGLLSVNLPDTPPSRFSDRALSILRPYLTARTVTRTR